MAKVFTSTRRMRRVTVVQGGGSGGEVNDDTLRVDSRNANHKAVDATALQITARDANRKAVDVVTAAVLGQANEVAKRAVDNVSNTVTAVAAEAAHRAADATAVRVSSAEMGRRASDQAAAIVVPTSDAGKRAVETTPLMVSGTASESGRRQIDQVQAAIVAAAEAAKRAAATDAAIVTLAGYANAVANNAVWTNPNNALGNTTGTAATLVATATGLAGTTNNTATGTLVLDFQDVNLGDLTISAVTVNVERQGATAGVAVAQPTSAVNFQYSFDNTNWTTIFALTTPATAKAVSTLDLTSVVGQDQSKLSALRVRATGSVTSGTGLGASNTVSFFRAWMTVNAARIYT